MKDAAVVDAENNYSTTNPVMRTTYDKNSNVTSLADPRGVVTSKRGSSLESSMRVSRLTSRQISLFSISDSKTKRRSFVRSAFSVRLAVAFLLYPLNGWFGGSQNSRRMPALALMSINARSHGRISSTAIEL